MTRSGNSRRYRGVFRNNPPLPRASEEDLQKLVGKLKEAHDVNASVFRDTLMALDAAVQAMAAVLDAHVSGSNVRLVDIEGTKRVDYNYYIQQFTQSLTGDKPESVIVSPEEDEFHIFGGSA